MSSVYVATSVENAWKAREFQSMFARAGWQVTYDSTGQGSLRGLAAKDVCDVALKQMRGVLDADVLVVVLPAGRGTHTELGIAVASNKPIVVYAPSDEHLEGPHLSGSSRRHCAFYYLPQVKIARSPAEVVAVAKTAVG